MAFNSANLSVLTYANGFTLWHYTTTDATTVVDALNYFNAAAGQMRVGDLIIARTSTGGTAAMGFYQVLSNDGTAVDVSDATVIAATDTR